MNKIVKLPSIIKVLTLLLVSLNFFILVNWVYPYIKQFVCWTKGLTVEQAFPIGATNTQLVDLAPIITSAMVTYALLILLFGKKENKEEVEI